MNRSKFTSLIIIAVIAATLTLGGDISAKNAHRFHSSLTTIDYNSDEKNIKISIQLIAHDVLEVFDEITRKSLELENSKEVDELLKKYIAEHFVMQDKNGEKLELKWVGKEIELERVFVYLEIPSDENIEGFKLSNTIFFETYPTQTNIIIANFNGEKADLLFTKKDGFKIIEPNEKVKKQKLKKNKLKIRYFRTTPQQADGVFARKLVGQSTDYHEFSKTKSNALSGLKRKPTLQADGEFF